METTQTNLLKSAATYGAILGAIIVIYSLILFVLNVMPVGFLIPALLFLFSLGIYFAAIFLGTKKIRNDILGGSMTYGQGLQIGVLISVFAAIITAFYSYIQNTLIDPEYMTRVMNAQKDWMSQFMAGKGLPEDQIEKTLAGIDEKMKNTNQVKNIFTSIVASTIFGFIISLITSGILKKQPNLFDETQSGQ
jgi:uncharacterized membrane protein (DUF106 family)